MSDTKSIRKGQELGETKVQAYLQQALAIEDGEIVVSQFPAGASNLTYCISLGNKEYVLRRPPFGSQVRSAHDMSREFNVLSKLSRVYKPAPKPLPYCGDENVIGAEFYLMERRLGLIIRGKLAVHGEFRLRRSKTRPNCVGNSAGHSSGIWPNSTRSITK